MDNTEELEKEQAMLSEEKKSEKLLVCGLGISDHRRNHGSGGFCWDSYVCRTRSRSF